MSRKWRIVFAGLVVLLLLLVVVPLLVPVPPLPDTVPPAELADADSRFIDVDGLAVHYKEQGAGEPALVLLHGFAASLFSWREVLDALSTYGRVVAYDRPAFGLTERPVGDQRPDVYADAYQPQLLVNLLDDLGLGEVILVGNSAGGTVAMLAALAYPERVKALILVDPAVYSTGGIPPLLRPLLAIPLIDRLGPLLLRQGLKNWGADFGRLAWHDPAKLNAEIWEGYTKPLQADNWDRALWQFATSGRPTGLVERLDELDLPVLVITGDDDRIVPTEESIRLAGELPNAELVVLPNCGHVPHEECPQAFMDAVDTFLAKLEGGA